MQYVGRVLCELPHCVGCIGGWVGRCVQAAAGDDQPACFRVKPGVMSVCRSKAEPPYVCNHCSGSSPRPRGFVVYASAISAHGGVFWLALPPDINYFVSVYAVSCFYPLSHCALERLCYHSVTTGPCMPNCNVQQCCLKTHGVWCYYWYSKCFTILMPAVTCGESSAFANSCNMQHSLALSSNVTLAFGHL